jgi:hypothetical protein
VAPASPVLKNSRNTLPLPNPALLSEVTVTGMAMKGYEPAEGPVIGPVIVKVDCTDCESSRRMICPRFAPVVLLTMDCR